MISYVYTTWLHDGPYVKDFVFENAIDLEEFLQDLAAVEISISKYQRGDCNENVEENCLLLCNNFCQTWGSSNLPYSIRMKINEIELHLEKNMTDFGLDTNIIDAGDCHPVVLYMGARLYKFEQSIGVDSPPPKTPSQHLKHFFHHMPLTYHKVS